MQPREVPVYVFTGFLESGKTSFALDNLKNPSFSAGEKTLVIACEQGEIEYELSDELKEDVSVVYLADQEDFTIDYLDRLELEYDFDRVMIEYNGMWSLNDLYQALPENWIIVQQINIIDSSTFTSYNNMFRNLMVEKFAGADFILFNRVSENDDINVFHKAVRQVSRRSEIVYEYEDGSGKYDDIVDPLPFDINAEVIDVDFKDYAFFIQDIVEEKEKYFGKKIHLTGQVKKNDSVKSGLVFGREVMTCCVADIKFMGLVFYNNTKEKIEIPGWYDIEAEIVGEKDNPFAKKLPVLKAYKITKAELADDTQLVATFY